MQINVLRQSLIFILSQALAYSPCSRADPLFLPSGGCVVPDIARDQHFFKAVIHLLKTLLSACFMLILSACGSGDEPKTTTQTVTEIPEFIQSISLLTVAGGMLKASISIDGGSPNPMTIDLINKTSSASLELSKEKHSITITFTYTFTDANISETVILATATKEIDLSNGADTLSFDISDYEIDSYDDDGDGVSNLSEIIAETDPTDPIDTPLTCILDDTNSKIGSCTLG